MNFNPQIDAVTIRQAISKPKDMNKLIQIVAHRSNKQRQEIKKEYFNKYQKVLTDDLKSELSGHFEEAVISLFSTSIEFDCDQLYNAMKGIGTNEDTLIEILSSRNNDQIKQIKDKYFQKYNKNLEKEIYKDTSGPFRKVLLKLLEATRKNTFPTELECNENAKRLYDAALNKKECLHDTFIYIFTEKSREELALIGKIYYKWYSKTLLELIDSLFSGDFRKTLKAIIYSLLSPSEYFTYRINKALKGIGTKDTILIRVLISRDEIDIGRIKRYYKQLYNKELYDAIKEDTSGDYRNLLLELIGQ